MSFSGQLWRSSGRRTVPGYRAGATLARMLADLQGVRVVAHEGACAELNTLDGALSFFVREKVIAQFLMHVVVLEFELPLPGAGDSACAIDVRHTGMLQRRALAYTVRRGARGDYQALLARLGGSSAVSRALMPLDFKRCELNGSASGWSVRIEHYGASEVVTRMPAMRRYIRLTSEQGDAMLRAFAAFRDLLATTSESCAAERS